MKKILIVLFAITGMTAASAQTDYERLDVTKWDWIEDETHIDYIEFQYNKFVFNMLNTYSYDSDDWYFEFLEGTYSYNSSTGKGTMRFSGESTAYRFEVFYIFEGELKGWWLCIYDFYGDDEPGIFYPESKK